MRAFCVVRAQRFVWEDGLGGRFVWEILYVGKERGKSEEERAEEVGG